MTYHGTSRSSMQNAATRAFRRALKEDKIMQWRAKVARHIRHPEAYQRAIEDNKRLGLDPRRMNREQANLKLISVCNRNSKKGKITLAGQQSETKVDERTLAEDQMIEAVRTSVELLSFHLVTLSHIPNPTPKYKNRMDQKYLVDLVGLLARSVTPAIETKFNEPIAKPRVALEHVCIDCGGPACIKTSSGQWYCEDCHV